MCLLTVMQPNSTPTREQLLQAACNNPHGFGYAIMFNDRIVTGRGMDAQEVIDRFLAIRERCPDTWAMFHHRYTTHGDTNKSNCHPFRVGGDEQIVLAHNGIIPINIPDGDKRSDTRIFAEDELPTMLEFLDDRDGFEMLEDYVGWSKVCIFSISPKLECNIYILNEDSGTWDNGIWWSNDSYKPSKWSKWSSLRPYGSWSYDGYFDDDYTSCEVSDPYHNDMSTKMSGWWHRSEDQSCVYCMSKMTDEEWEWGYCDRCKSCLECANDIVDCLCDRSEYFEKEKRDYKYWWEEEGAAMLAPAEGAVIG